MDDEDEELSFDVYVVDDEGNPISGEEVVAFFTYSFWPRTNSTEHTDEEGHAEFSSEHPSMPLEVELYVRSTAYGPYAFEDGAGYTIEV